MDPAKNTYQIKKNEFKKWTNTNTEKSYREETD